LNSWKQLKEPRKQFLLEELMSVKLARGPNANLELHHLPVGVVEVKVSKLFVRVHL